MQWVLISAAALLSFLFVVLFWNWSLRRRVARETAVLQGEVNERRKNEAKLHDYQQRLKGLAAELTHTEERERRAIAAELHDNVGQSLAVMRMQLAAAKKETRGRKVEVALDEVSDSLREAIRETRNIIADLSPPTLNELGLCAAIAELLKEQFEGRYGLQTRFYDDSELRPLSQDASIIAYRSVRELLMNVVKHAVANFVTVRIQDDGDFVMITVEDDGAGMPADPRQDLDAAEGGFGLFSIKERMQDLGGSLSIESRTGQGVRATLALPLEKGA